MVTQDKIGSERSLALQPIRIAGDEGLLVFADEELVAVLTHLEADWYAADHGKWFMEAAFRPLDGSHRTFETRQAALDWIVHELPPQQRTATAKGTSGEAS